MKSLERTLRYRNPQMPRRIQRAVGCGPKAAESLFNDVKSWLWLCARHRNAVELDPALKAEVPDLRMLQHFRAIDLGWHEFILMTREYSAFCDEYLDGYIHHTPAPITRRLTLPRRLRADSETLTPYFGFIYDVLGEEIFHRWTHRLPKVRSSR